MQNEDSQIYKNKENDEEYTPVCTSPNYYHQLTYVTNSVGVGEG